MIGGNRLRDYAHDDEPKQDIELTLGPLKLAVLGGCLLALCFVCFVVGYVAGKHATPSAVQKQAEVQPLQAAQTSAAKPSAVTSSPRVQSAPDVTADSAADVEGDEVPAPLPAASPAPVPVQQQQQAPLVHPALPVQTSQPATAQPTGVMVQVAAVAQMEDAQVLVGALRKRGFAAAIRRDTTDGMLHVQVGPFVNRNDASVARQRLLNEGYNAVLQ
jgi:cell division septation protein DedD